MAYWDDLDSSFGADETINFGPRYETGSALYQVNTFATLSSSNNKDIDTYPSVVSEELGDLFSVAVNNNLSLFDGSQFIITLKFECCVDALGYCPDGSHLIVGDQKGIIFIVDIHTSDIIFTFNLLGGKKMSGDHAFRKIIVMKNKDGQWDLLILLSTGELLVFKDLNKDLFAAKDLAAKLHKKLVFRTETSTIHGEGAVDMIVADKNIITAGNGITMLAKWSWIDGELKLTHKLKNFLKNNAGIKSIQVISNGKYFFMLDENETLSFWNTTAMVCLETLSDLAVSEFNILDMSALSSSSLKNIRIVLLRKENEGETLLEVRQLPDFECIYQLKLGVVVQLSHSPSTQENLNIIEGCADAANPQSITSLRFRLITESEPETRFLTLLRKMRFEEANNFAEKYDLDKQPLHKAHLKHILDLLSPWRKETNEKRKEYTEKLWQILKLIKGDHFVVQSCLSTSLITFSDTHQLLEYTQTRLINKPSNEKTEVDSTLLMKVNHMLYRLHTFSFAVGRKYYKAEVWEQFKKADLFDKIINYFSCELLHVAFTIWRRHQHEISKLHSIDSLELLLSSIPGQTSITDLLPWLLEDFIPYVLRVVPRHLNVLMSWIILKIQKMEIHEKVDWPSNALDVMESIYERFTSLLTSCCDQVIPSPSESASKVYTNYRKILAPLINLLTMYRNLVKLHNKYNCKLTAANFAQETTESVVFRMLDRLVAIELMEKTLQEVIRPYIKEYKLNEDEIFCKYIKDLLERTHRITYLGQAHWEPKALAVIGYISDVKQKISAVLEVMKWAPIPWSADISKLVDSTSQLKQPEVENIKKHSELVQMKLCLLKYGLRGVDVPVPNSEEALQMSKYIIHKDLPDSMKDALHLLKPADNVMKREIYVFRLRQLMLKDQLKECMDLLKSLEPELSKCCAHRLLQYCLVDLDEEGILDINETNQSKTLAIKTGRCLIEFLKSLSTDFLETEELDDLKKDLHCLQSLQVEFQLYPRLCQFQHPDAREKILWDYINTTVPEFNLTPEQESKLYRLAELLKVPRVYFLSQIIMKAFQGKHTDVFLRVCKKLLQCNVCPQTAETVYDLCMYLMEDLAVPETDVEVNDLDSGSDNFNLPAVIHRLISLALTSCHPTSLTKFLHLASTVQLAAISIQLTGVTDDDFLSSTINEDNTAADNNDVIKNWSLISQFKEDDFIMESSSMLPLIANSVRMDPLLNRKFPPFVPVNIDDKCDGDDIQNQKYEALLQQYTDTIPPLLEYFRSNQNLEFVYRHCLHFIFTVVEYHISCHPTISDTQEGYNVKDMMKFPNKIATINKFPHLITEILYKVFSQRNVDHMFALGLGWSLPKKALGFMKKMRQDFSFQYRRQMALNKVGIALAVLHNEPEEIQQSVHFETMAYWGYQLGKYKISLKAASSGLSNLMCSVLQQMATCTSIDIEVVKKFCKDFDIDEDDMYEVYMKYVVKSLTFTQQSGTNTTTNSQHPQLQRNRLLKVIRSAKSKARLLNGLTQLINLINMYDYETLGLVLEEASRLENNSSFDKCKKVLNWLKNYTRKTPISNYERHFCPEGNQENYVIECVPAISSSRLAFHALLNEPWHIISNEVNVDNVEEWYILANILKLSLDQLYVVALQNSIKVYVSSLGVNKNANTLEEKSQCRWGPDAVNKDMMNSIENTLKKIKDSESTLALATYVMKDLPIGAEKVLALKLCVSFANNWLQAEKDATKLKKAETARLKFKMLYEKLATEQVLFCHKMATPELLDTCSDPRQLITELYKHPSILDSTLPEHLCPDINSMARQIADIHQIPFQQLQHGLLCEWLSNSKTEDIDMTMTFDFGNAPFLADNSQSDDSSNFKRVAYVLRSGSLVQNLAFLLGYSGLEGDTMSISNVCRLQALLCVFDIATIEDINKIASITLEDIRRLIQNQFYIVKLEKLNIAMTANSFEECNKEKLAKSIWKNHSNGKMAEQAAGLVYSLCLDYKFYSVSMWQSIIDKMKSLHMMKELEHVLLHILEIPCLATITSVASTWQAVIVSILNKPFASSDEKQNESLHAFNLIQRCPSVLSLDLNLLSQHFSTAGLPVCALSCLLMSAVTNDKLLKKILSVGAVTLFDSLLLVRRNCITSAIYFEVMGMIFQLISQKNLSHIVKNTPLEDTYREYVQDNPTIVQQNGVH
ncbi:kinetochore-associated protein 1-like [Argonauta hians]